MTPANASTAPGVTVKVQSRLICPLVQVKTPLRAALPDKFAPAKTRLELVRLPFSVTVLVLNRVWPAPRNALPAFKVVPKLLRLIVPVLASTVPLLFK